MVIPEDEAARAAERRRRAEASASGHAEPLPGDPDAPPSEAFLRTLHDLHVHQVELENQNEELRRIQAELEQARARYFYLYDHAPVGYCTLAGSGLVLEANQTAGQMLAWPLDRLIGKPFIALIHRDDRADYHARRARFRAHGEPFTCEVRLLPRNGPAFWASLSAKPATDPGPQEPPPRPAEHRAWMVLADISERKRAESEQACLEAQVRHAQRLEAIGRLAGGMAHDFNNLLGAMAGNLDLLRPVLSSAPAQARLDALDQLVARAASQVARILTFAGKAAARSQALDLNQQVEAMAGLLRSSLPARAALGLDLGAGLPAMVGDPSLVQQVILNLVLNAAEALEDDGGTITLRTRLETLTASDLRARHPGQDLAPGPYLALAVADPGTGMAPEVRERIFDPYFSTRFAGRGLGLSVVHGVLASHRGGIRVDSRDGQGTTVTVLFPAGPGPAGAPRAAAAPEAALQGYGRVLVVEDEPALRAVAAQALDQLGFEPLEAADGLEALRLYEAHRDDLRLVFLDLTMPVMDGEQAYRELRRAGAAVPIVLTSGFGAEEVLRQFQGRGVAGFLAKPYRLRELAGALQAALGRTGAREPVPWNPSCATGHPGLDANHQDLIQAFNRIVRAVAKGEPGEPARALGRLIDAAIAHFGLEESLMQATGCPSAREHQAGHAQLIAQLQDLARRIQRGEASFTAPVLDFLQDWVVCHIQTDDQVLARHLKRDGH